MAEYIKRSDALNICRRYSHRCFRSNNARGQNTADEIEGDIFVLPTADVEEVKHGEWIKTDRGIRKNLNTGQPMRVYACECSCCGWHTGNQGVEFDYCPKCGAKMDG